LKATPLDEDENGEPDDITTDNENANGLKISFAAEDVYYNRDLIHNETVKVGTVTLDENSYIVTFYSDSACTTEVTPVNAGTYYAKITVLDTDNYDGGSKVVSFEIMRVKLEGVEFSYSHGNATWTAVANDIGKTADETGVAAKELKDGTTVTYNVYNGETLIGTYNTREFAALAATTYKVIAEADDDNYIASESVMLPAYEVSFDEGNHDENPDGDVSDMPDAQYIFENETAIEPDTDPSVDGCTFMNWSLNDVEYLFNEAVTGHITIVAIWNGLPYTITIKYLDSSETLNTDMFVLELFYGDTVDYSELGIAPVKSSDNAGIYYTFANKWVDAENNEYDAVNGTISGFIITEDMTFVAVFDTNYNSFIITYYFFNNVTDEYDQFGDTQEVIYNQVIDYRTFDGENYAWFIQDYWYGNEARTAAVPAKMPAEDISVYGAYKFDIGQGDVNADGNISSDDITLYRQWIVGGYEMTVVESGTEWALVTGGDYDANVRYFLKRVADNNIDESKDIRDVSITRMAIVGGYDWDISIGETVTGQNIDRTKTATTIANIVNGLTEYGRTRMYVNLTDTTADIEFNVSGNLYLDLGGKTLTVKSFVLNTIGKNATITVKNGTIMTVDGITITAPNGNVILQDLTGYIGDAQVNLQAADSSLHFAGVVEFYANENEEFVPAVINVEEGTHIVIEQAAELTIEKIVVTENFEAAPSAAVTLDNKTSNDVVIEGAIENNISSLSELIAAMNNGGSYILGEDIAYTGTLVFEKDTSINLNGYTLRSTNSNAMYVTDGATLTVSGNGNVIAQEFAAVAFDKSTLIINGGTYTTYDNAVFGTNGTSGRGENTIIINGGTFNGGIQSAGYVACGIYVANNDTVTVNAGTFNITNGVGILARSGNTTVSENVVFNVTGNGTFGKVGDSKVTVPAGEVFVVDYAANYPGGDPTFTKNGEYKVCYILGGINNSLSPERADAVIGEALPGSTVILLNDIDYSTTYTVRNARDYGNGHVVDLKDLTLDLNGHTIKTINATVVFSGNGATIKNGTFDLVEKDTDGSYKDGSYALIIDNSVASYGKEGTVTVKDVTVDGGVNVCSATVTLDNVTAHTTTTKFYTVWAETNATITINGGTYTDEQAKGKGIFATGKNAEGGAKIYVNGGTYTGVNKLVYSAEDGAIVITGGTFNLDPSDCVDIANYEVT
ncbi:MAG: hypothetical protein J6Y43_05220, partial [Clostridia bacterium]|nr:hypothetical protein [Clostridia bacterium]